MTFAILGDGGAEPKENKMTSKILNGISFVLAAVQPARETGTENLGIRFLPPMQWNKGFVTGFALAFSLVGHFNPATRTHYGDRMFRGLIDEVRLFGNSLDGTGALSLDEIRTIHKC